MENPRELALKSLVKSDTSSVFSNLEINTVLERSNLEGADRGLYTALYLGVLEKKMALDYIIEKYSKIPLNEIGITELNILRLGIYQLYYMDKIPDYSATNESVNLAPKKSKGFINAIIRSFIRDNKKVDFPKEKWQGVSVKYSIPMDLIKLFIDSYGEDTTYDMITKTSRTEELSIRVNTLKATTDKVLCELKKRGAEPRASEYASDIIKCNITISEISDLISSGEIFIQDEASRLCSIAVGASENEIIADVCACPGGKSFSMSIDMKNKGQLFSSDLHKSKLSLITKGAERLGIDIISVKEQNAKECVDEYKDKFDRVLCDVPCSGLGIIFKKPDIKYKDINDINNLPRVQFDILSNCSRYVKKGGTLVYSTCTLNSKENEENINKFLLENDSFEMEDFTVGGIKSTNGMKTFMPHIEKTDGFFVAKLRRVK